jgi:DnaJ-domain-containing protein 1
MTITQRLINLAKANLNALLDEVAEREGGRLDDLSDNELEAELMRRRERRERDEEQRQSREDAQRAARARSASTAAGRESAGAGSGTNEARPRGEGAGRRGSVRGPDARTLAQYYAQLEVPVGASLAEVKSSFRRLMRRYHPDRFADNPEKAKLATELTQKLTQAYRELEAVLKDQAARGKRM